MKKIIGSLALISGVSMSAHAQIPNAGFENWTTVSTYENPDGWATLNDYTTAASVYTATKGTPGSPGNSYLKLTSKTVGPTVVNGIAVSGVINPATQQPVSGFAFNQQPGAFTGKWQHMIYGSSQGSINVQLTRWDAGTNSRIVVATANQVLSGMAMSWANFSIPFVYTDAQAPDSCLIVMKASGSTPTNMDYLWVDNLAFSGNVAGLNSQSLFGAFEVYPNPSNDGFKVTLNSKEVQKVTVELVSNSGAVLYTQPIEILQGTSEIFIPTEGMVSGNYVIRLVSGNSNEIRAVVIH